MDAGNYDSRAMAYVRVLVVYHAELTRSDSLYRLLGLDNEASGSPVSLRQPRDGGFEEFG